MIYDDVTDSVIQKDLFAMLVEVYAALAIFNLFHNLKWCEEVACVDAPAVEDLNGLGLSLLFLDQFELHLHSSVIFLKLSDRLRVNNQFQDHPDQEPDRQRSDDVNNCQCCHKLPAFLLLSCLNLCK